MEWDREASGRLERVPVFIRKKVKGQIEQYVRERGGERVTVKDVTEARQALAGGPGGGHSVSRSGASAGPGLAPGGLTAADVERIQEMVEKGPAAEGLNTPFRQVRVCGAAAGCPLSLIEDSTVAGSLARVLDGSGLDRHIGGRVDGPVLFHHKFKVAVAGCPNACSQPQIVDFGVVGQSRPGRVEDRCTGCGACVETCEEGAVSLQPAGPVFDRDRCLNCGRCIQSCPAGGIREEKKGYRVMLGGKLGRHPRLSDPVLDLADMDQVMAALEGAARVFMEHRQGKERLAGVVDRLGPDRVREMVLGRKPPGVKS